MKSSQKIEKNNIIFIIDNCAKGRELLGYKQKDMATILGVAGWQISRFEKHYKGTNIMLANYLSFLVKQKISPEWLLTKNNKKINPFI